MSDSETPPGLLGEATTRLKDYLILGGAALGPLTVLYVTVKEIRDYVAEEPMIAGVIASAVALLFLFVVVGLWRDRRRRDWLVEVGRRERAAQGLSEYFKLSPRTARDHDAFERDDEAHRDVLDWIVLAAGAPFLWLTGRSGVGKSSILSAHVIPELRRQDPPFVVIEARGYADPLGALSQALLTPGTVWDAPPSLNDPRILLEQAAERCCPSRILVILDQFEEFAVLKTADEQAPVRAFLSDLESSPIRGAQILFSARNDEAYLKHLQDLGLSRMTLNETWFVIDGFDQAEAQRFLQACPDLFIPPPLIRTALREARDLENGASLVPPVVLNLLGLAIKRLAGSDPRAARRRGLARSYLEGVLNGSDVQQLGPPLLRCLITDAGTKRPVTEPALEAAVRQPAGVARGVLSLLSRHGLVREIDRSTRTWEVSHDFVARLLGQILGRLRIPRTKRLLRWAGPTAIAGWLLVGLGLLPAYFAIWLPADIRRNGVSLRPSDQGWVVSFASAETPRGAAVPELERVLPLLHRLGGNVSALTISNQDDVETIDLTAFHALDLLQITDNSLLREFQIPDLLNLRNMSIYNNRRLEHVDVPELSSLESLEIVNNPEIESVTIREIPYLRRIVITDNNLIDLYIYQLLNLSYLYIRNNPQIEPCREINEGPLSSASDQLDDSLTEHSTDINDLEDIQEVYDWCENSYRIGARRELFYSVDEHRIEEIVGTSVTRVISFFDQIEMCRSSLEICFGDDCQPIVAKCGERDLIHEQEVGPDVFNGDAIDG